MRRRPVRASASISRDLVGGRDRPPARSGSRRAGRPRGCARCREGLAPGTVNIYSPPLTDPVADHRRHRRARLRPGAALGPRRRARRHRLARRGPRRRGRRARRARPCPTASFEGFENAEAAARAEVVVLCVPFRNQSETLTNLKERLREGQLFVDATVPLAAAVSGRPRACSASGRAPPPSRRRRWSPTACASSARCTPSAPRRCGDLDHALDEDVLVCGDRKADKQRVDGADRAHRRPALRRLRAPGEGAHRRVAHRAADRHQRRATRRTRASSITGA